MAVLGWDGTLLRAMAYPSGQWAATGCAVPHRPLSIPAAARWRSHRAVAGVLPMRVYGRSPEDSGPG